MISKVPAVEAWLLTGAHSARLTWRRLHADAAAAVAAGTGQPFLRNVIAAYGDGMFAS